jgi:glycine cleavage system H lipoate-binding protein
MKISTLSRPRIHFTKNHEWIDFNGTVGFVGISAFRLSGIGSIDSIRWCRPAGVIEKGTLVAEILAGDFILPVCAPVKCKFLGRNQGLGSGLNLILESPQDKGWLFFIAPSVFGKQNDTLLTPEDYQKLIRVNTF